MQPSSAAYIGQTQATRGTQRATIFTRGQVQERTPYSSPSTAMKVPTPAMSDSSGMGNFTTHLYYKPSPLASSTVTALRKLQCECLLLSWHLHMRQR